MAKTKINEVESRSQAKNAGMDYRLYCRAHPKRSVVIVRNASTAKDSAYTVSWAAARAFTLSTKNKKSTGSEINDKEWLLSIELKPGSCIQMSEGDAQTIATNLSKEDINANADNFQQAVNARMKPASCEPNPYPFKPLPATGGPACDAVNSELSPLGGLQGLGISCHQQPDYANLHFYKSRYDIDSSAREAIALFSAIGRVAIKLDPNTFVFFPTNSVDMPTRCMRFPAVETAALGLMVQREGGLDKVAPKNVGERLLPLSMSAGELRRFITGSHLYPDNRGIVPCYGNEQIEPVYFAKSQLHGNTDTTTDKKLNELQKKK